MTKIIENEEGNSGQIILGDETSHQAISFKLAQAFYSEITGKSEKITENLTRSFVLTIENVQQLHQRIIQSTTQYNVASANVAFSVEYRNDSSERFSSIERFMTHAGSKGIAVSEVYINYRFLIILPETSKPQEYRINIRLISRVVKLEEIRETMGELSFSIPLWEFDSGSTCRVSIDFIDITVANSFMSVVKNWNNGLDEVDTNMFVKKIRPIAKHMPSAFQYGLLFAGSYYTLDAIDQYFSAPQAHTTAMFILVAFLFNFIMWKLGNFTGSKTESHLNGSYEMSYISFSGADKKLAQECSTTKRNNALISAAYVVGTIVIGVLSSGISALIFGEN